MIGGILNRRAIRQAFAWRSILRNAFCTDTNSRPSKYLTDLEVTSLENQPNELREQIISQIEMTGGEMKLSKYWSLALTHPTLGYYTSRNAFSKKGDFTTSPEISQLFGEMIGVWIVHFLQTKLNSKHSSGTANAPYRLVELGGGRGLLMADLLRTLNNFQAVPQCISMIEASELQSREQQKQVLDWFDKQGMYFKFSYELKNKEVFVGENNSTQLQWFKSFEDLMLHDTEAAKENSEAKPLPMICVSNQFFDALPTTPLVYTGGTWREKVVVVDSNGQLQFGVSKFPVIEKLAPTSKPEQGSVMEINYGGLMLMESMSQLIHNNDGAIITVDYGNDFTHSNSIRAIRQHKYIESPKWLNLPGKCDLSAYVDFQALKAYVEKVPGMTATQAMPQGYFLEAMGIHARADILLRTANEEKRQRILSECHRLTHPQEMGEIYKIQLATRNENTGVYPFMDFQATENVF